MTLILYAHPFSSYCQKVLIALYEHGAAFEMRMLSQDAPENMERLAHLWPIGRFPVLCDNERTLIESSIIIEHVDLGMPGPQRLIPADAKTALNTRFMDRFFDAYVMTPMQQIVFDTLRPPELRDRLTVDTAKTLLEKAYAWLDGRIAGQTWASGEAFTLADCAAAPALLYADWVHPILDGLTETRAYRARLLARASVARVVDEARPYRSFFPPGAPDRD